MNLIIYDLQTMTQAPSGDVIYFLKDESFIKIGTTGDIRNRLMHYRTHNPRNIHLCGLFKGSRKEEKFFHTLFNEYRLPNTEWFVFQGKLKEHFANIQSIDINSFIAQIFNK